MLTKRLIAAIAIPSLKVVHEERKTTKIKL
jgi:hypothetical protein